MMRKQLWLVAILIATSGNGAAAVGPQRGYLIIHGGGGGTVCQRDSPPAVCNEHLDEFVRLAGGDKASIVIIPTAALWEDSPAQSVPIEWLSVPQNYGPAFQERYASL